MLVFAPEFTDPAGTRRVIQRVNNSVAVFCAGSLHLDFFIDACVRIARQREVVGKLEMVENRRRNRHAVCRFHGFAVLG